MEWLGQYLAAAGDLVADLWLYMIVGFLVAGVVDEFVSEKRLLRYFGGNRPGDLVRGAATGFVVSACSCGAIPLVAMLRDRGASTATTLTFLLAAPWLGLPMLLVYVSFLGWPRTLLLLALSLMVAITCGLVMARLERRGAIAQGVEFGGSVAAGASDASCGDACRDDGCGDGPGAVGDEGCGDGCREGGDEARDPEGAGSTGGEESLARRLFVVVPRRAWDLGRDIGLYLAFGIVLAAVPKAFLEPQTVAAFMGVGAGPLAILTALPIAVLIEACSEGFAVIAGQLFEMGATLAVVFLITMVGVATDFTELTVIWGKFGRRTTLVYLGLGTALTLVVALLLQGAGRL